MFPVHLLPINDCFLFFSLKTQSTHSSSFKTCVWLFWSKYDMASPVTFRLVKVLKTVSKEQWWYQAVFVWFNNRCYVGWLMIVLPDLSSDLSPNSVDVSGTPLANKWLLFVLFSANPKNLFFIRKGRRFMSVPFDVSQVGIALVVKHWGPHLWLGVPHGWVRGSHGRRFQLACFRFVTMTFQICY